MANSNDTEEGIVSPEESTTDLEEYQEMSETNYGIGDLDASPGIVLPLHEPMDVDIGGQEDIKLIMVDGASQERVTGED
ncbi:hypothetical protein ACMFMG_012004 [Clarireedia jacksonii]